MPLPFFFLLDDDEDDRFIMEAVAQAESIDLVASGDYGSFFTMLSLFIDSTLPCLIILDYNMPAMNGSDVLFLLKQHAQYKDIPVVIFSTSLTPTQQSELKAQGAAGCYIKPAHYDESVRLFKEMKTMYC